MVSVLCCCANGSGTSLLMSMALEKAIKAQGYTQIEKVKHGSINEAKNIAVNYDIVFCPKDFTGLFAEAAEKGVRIIGLDNVMSDKEMTEKLAECGMELK